MQKPSIPKGTRDFSPEETAKRNYIFDTIKEVYRLYGFRQIETPAMENLSTLMGKYGEEGDKLLFKILDSGDYLYSFGQEDLERLFLINNEIRDKIDTLLRSRKAKKDILNNINNINKSAKINNPELYKYIGSEVIKRLETQNIIYKKSENSYSSSLTINKLKQKIEIIIDEIIRGVLGQKVGKEKGLRYDLTVPFARYVVMHRNDITFPFKRYQIQPVWRADRPQKGRYREFFQCDADIVGSDSLLNEVELIQIIDRVFSQFGIRVSVKLNNRKILSGIAEIIGEADKITDITVAIDKLDKIGTEKVNEELASKGISQEAIERLQPILLLSGTSREKLGQLKEVLTTSSTGLKGVEELEYIFDKTDLLSLKNELTLDLTLARGLNYYTGAIIEVKALDVEIGSITGGGRYDNLTGIFGLPGVSGVGISFGADRIYDVLNQLNLFPENFTHTTDLLFVNFGETEAAYLLPVMQQLRSAGIRCELYPDAGKMKKQMSYADSNHIPFVAIVGENEMTEGKIMLKNMESGEQKPVTVQEIISEINK